MTVLDVNEGEPHLGRDRIAVCSPCLKKWIESGPPVGVPDSNGPRCIWPDRIHIAR